jgi:hypothetical protein
MEDHLNRPLHCVRTIAALSLMLALVACGGGSADSGTPTPPNNPPATPPATPPASPPANPPATPPVTPPVTPPSTTFSASFASFAVAASADTSSNAALEDRSVTFTVTNSPTSGLWYRANVTGIAVRDVELSFTSGNAGQVRLLLFRPGQLGAGTHVSTVPIEFCSTANCSTVIAGPYNIVVTYTVSGSALPTTRISMGAGPRVTTTHSVTQTTSLEKSYGMSIENLPPAGIWIRRVSPADGIILGSTIRDVTFEANGASAVAFLAFTVAPPASLGSGVKAGYAKVRACFDSACIHPVPDAEVDLYADLIIHAEEGTQFTRRIVKPANGATDVAWAGASGFLYVASSIGLNNEPKVLQVDPATGNIVQSLLIAGQNLGRLAVSDDGSKLFVSTVQPSATMADSKVRRLSLPSLVEEAAVTLDPSTAFGSVPVHELVAMPGDNATFTASLGDLNGDLGIYAYDSTRKVNGVPRVSTGFQRGRYLTPGASPGIYYSLRHGALPPYSGAVERLSLDSTGVQVVGSFPFSGDIRSVHFGAGKLFFLDGQVRDANTGVVLPHLEVPANFTLDEMIVDQARSRLYAISNNEYVLSFDINTHKLLALAPTGVSTQRATFKHHIMRLWGSEGLAVVDGTNLVVLSGSFFTTYDGAPTMAVPPSSP